MNNPIKVEVYQMKNLLHGFDKVGSTTEKNSLKRYKNAAKETVEMKYVETSKGQFDIYTPEKYDLDNFWRKFYES